MDAIQKNISEIYAKESRRVLATLIRLLKDFDLAEEALHDAFIAALKQWPVDGLPSNPRAWLVSTGRFKAIDHLRRRAIFNASLGDLARELDDATSDSATWADEHIEDDQLKLIFTCCHPSIAQEAQIALTLREICGLTTEEIARVFFAAPTTIAQRIVRAKNKIRDAAIPYEIPTQSQLPDRLNSVLHVIYLMFNEGYSASFGTELTRADLSREAIRLGRLLMDLLPEPEVLGLLALMLIQDSRRNARVTSTGDIIILEEQDRSLWNRAQIVEGSELIKAGLAKANPGVYLLQAAIAAVHAEAPTSADTDWREIVGLYDVLMLIAGSPVVALNRAVAIAMRDTPAAGLAIIDDILARGELMDYYLAHAARADLLRRMGRIADAIVAYNDALHLTRQEPERRFLLKRLEQLASG